MKLLTKNTDYALRTLIVLGMNPQECLSARNISEKQKIPYSFLRKICQSLIRHNLVESKEGGKGGFRIKKQPKQIRVLDVIKIFQGDIQLSECMFRAKICHNRANCVLRENITQIEKIIESKFKGLTIGKLIKQSKLKRRKK